MQSPGEESVCVAAFEQVFLPDLKIKAEPMDSDSDDSLECQPASQQLLTSEICLKEEELQAESPPPFEAASPPPFVGELRVKSSLATPRQYGSGKPFSSSSILKCTDAGSSLQQEQGAASEPGDVVGCRQSQALHAASNGAPSQDPPAAVSKHRGAEAARTYPCPTCGKQFPRPSNLKRHQVSHSVPPKNVSHAISSRKRVKKEYFCKECNRQYSSSGNLRKHMLLHSDDRPFKCPHCSKGFTQSVILKRHVSQVHLKVKDFTCKHCNKQFYDLHLLSRHITTVHDPTKGYDCSICNTKHDSKSSLKLHILSEHYGLTDIFSSSDTKISIKQEPSEITEESRPKVMCRRAKNDNVDLVCPECHKEYSSATNLRKHLMLLHSDVRPFKCPHCSKGFTFNAKLKCHVAQVHLKVKNYKCPQCNKEFYDFHQMFTHISTVHENTKSFTCNYCNKSYGHKLNLEVHIHTKHNNIINKDENYMKKYKETINNILHSNKLISNIFPFRCDTCFKMFKKESKLSQHIAVIHNKEKPHVCEQCNKAFGFKSKLKYHMQSEHCQRNASGLFDCPFCSKSFKFKSLFIRHNTSTHIKVKKLICSLCEKKFSNKNNLQLHIKNIHDEKRYQCRLCDKRFSFKSTREIHEFESHKFQLDPGKFECSVCLRRFCDVSKLNVHQASKHSQFKCDLCNVTLHSKTLIRRHLINVHVKKHPN